MIGDQRERIEARSLDAKLKSTHLNVSFTFSEALAKRSTGRTSTPIESGGRRRRAFYSLYIGVSLGLGPILEHFGRRLLRRHKCDEAGAGEHA